MPYFEQQMIDAYRELDRKLADEDPSGARACCSRIQQVASQSSTTFGPAWLASVIKDKGIRLPYLERALKVEKVVLTGDVSLQHDFLSALSGRKPFAIDRATIELRITY